jgi:hypothetical protein
MHRSRTTLVDRFQAHMAQPLPAIAAATPETMILGIQPGPARMGKRSRRTTSAARIRRDSNKTEKVDLGETAQPAAAGHAGPAGEAAA